MKIVMGLGNPGRRHERARHNMGFLVVDRFALGKGASVTEKKYRSLVGRWQMAEEKVLLVKPQTYMNRSGEAVRHLFRYNPVAVEDLVIVHDDLDLPFGRIRVRARGSAGGHRGVASIIDTLKQQDFFRVRVGIGRPPPGEDPTVYVLEPFSAEQAVVLDQIIARAADAVETLLGEGARRAMDKFNRID